MENAAEALKMAAAVLIFVVALSISINSFGQVRRTSQIILDYKDREYDYEYVEDKYNGSKKRNVGVETIIPTIYKSYNENFKIIFEDEDIDCIYQKEIEGEWQKVNYIDIENEEIASEEQKRNFVQAILYGRKGIYFWNYKGEPPFFNDILNEFIPKHIKFNDDNGLYEKIKGKKYEESLGIYIQEEIYSSDGSEVPDTNKDEKRVITYKKTN